MPSIILMKSSFDSFSAVAPVMDSSFGLSLIAINTPTKLLKIPFIVPTSPTIGLCILASSKDSSTLREGKSATAFILAASKRIPSTMPSVTRIFLSRFSWAMKSRRIFAGNAGSSYPMASDSGPLKCSLAIDIGVPSAAKTANVFFTTLSSALTPLSRRRSSVTSWPSNPTHSVRTATRARLNFSWSSAIASVFASLRILASPDDFCRHGGLIQRLAQHNGIEADAGPHCGGERHRLQIPALA